MSRIVTVFGATGTQGSAVVNGLLEDGTFTPRAVTRNPASEAAQKLKARGAEVVQGDLEDSESLKKALAGSEAVFGVTQPFDQKSTGEFEQGKRLIDAAKEVGVKFFIWSTLPYAAKISNGKYNMPHLDDKARIEEYLNKSGLPGASLSTGWFLENLWNHGALAHLPTGDLNLVVPCYPLSAPLALTWIERDLPQGVLALLKNYQTRSSEILGNTFHVVTSHITSPEFARVLTTGIGKKVEFVSPATSGIPPLDEMYKFYSENDIYRDQEVPDSRLVKLGAKFSTVEEFAKVRLGPYVVSKGGRLCRLWCLATTDNSADIEALFEMQLSKFKLGW